MSQVQISCPKIQQANQKYEMRKERERQMVNPLQLFVCFEQNQKKVIPLRSVKYHLKIYNGLQIVQIEQIFLTEAFNQPLDLEYVFSINENAAVTKMKVELGEQIVYGIVKEKEEAKQEFEEGIKQGKTMAYSEEDEQFPQIKRLKIGQLAPNKQLRVIFEYIQPLEVYLNKFWKIDISPIIDENYQKNQSDTQIGFNKIVRYLNGMFQLKDFTFEYQQDIEIEFDTGSPITFWKSPTHQLHSTNAKDIEGIKQENGKRLVLKLDDDNPESFKPLKKFTLLFSSNDINLPRAILSHTNNDALQVQKYCATLTFISAIQLDVIR
ncbi:unnamed protein product (macronuclear) [Paramecium tetraurelia]|uniref:VIT domain-containing protein n=1 Tax=Paramecium tetraurelia TaxID=5888 RepID=A0BYA7_PARTE|nr:uncharacterized protein GSPATT00033377001 [Paramecium tetraurelia]CAK63524.1 unnamed protein product [Paramecium tetraurelia]|eukprot:XP_001430922.1 hypothetical protein (macronuclear) [Paramecium tetraurelia strain d4-2]